MAKSETNLNSKGRWLETVSVILISAFDFVADFGFWILDFPDFSPAL